MKIHDTSMTYEIRNRTQQCHIRLFSHQKKMIAVLSDFASAGTNQIFDDVESISAGIRRSWEIPEAEFELVIHFPGAPERGIEPWFSLFETGAATPSASGTVLIAGRVLRLEEEDLHTLIGETWASATGITEPFRYTASASTHKENKSDIAGPLREAIANLRLAASLTSAPTEEDRTAFLDSALELEMWMRRER